MAITPDQRYGFNRSKRLHGRRAFGAVYGARCRKHVGPLTLFGRLNDVGHCRLGLSVSRRVGKAVRRNRIKRLLREAFRLIQHELPGGVDAPERSGGYDVIVVVRPHEPAGLGDYQRWLLTGIEAVQRQWRKQQKQPRPSTPPTPRVE